MKINQVLGKLVSAYIVITVAPMMIKGTIMLLELPVIGITSLVDKVKYYQQIEKTLNEKESKIIDVEYHDVWYVEKA